MIRVCDVRAGLDALKHMAGNAHGANLVDDIVNQHRQASGARDRFSDKTW